MEGFIVDVSFIFIALAFLGFFIKESYSLGLKGFQRYKSDDIYQFFSYMLLSIIIACSITFFISWFFGSPYINNPIIYPFYSVINFFIQNIGALDRQGYFIFPGAYEYIVKYLVSTIFISYIILFVFCIFYLIGRLKRYTNDYIEVNIESKSLNETKRYNCILDENDNFIFFGLGPNNFWEALKKEDIKNMKLIENNNKKYLKYMKNLYNTDINKFLHSIVEDYWSFIYIIILTICLIINNFLIL